MEKAIAVLMAVVFVGALALDSWLLWLLWCWVMPQLWAGGPQNVIQPSYWLFAGAWFLLSLLGKAVFGRADK